MGGRERRIRRKSDERHEPVLGHRRDADGVDGVDVQHRLQRLGPLVQGPVTLIGERHAVDVAEQHRAAQAQRGDGALQLGGRRGGVVERQRGQRREPLPPGPHDGGERVVHEPGQGGGARRRLDVRARRREGQYLQVHALALQHLLAIGDVAVPAHGNVVVARVADDRIALVVGGQLHGRGALPQRVEVFRRIVVVVKIDDHPHPPSGSSSPLRGESE